MCVLLGPLSSRPHPSYLVSSAERRAVSSPQGALTVQPDHSRSPSAVAVAYLRSPTHAPSRPAPPCPSPTVRPHFRWSSELHAPALRECLPSSFPPGRRCPCPMRWPVLCMAPSPSPSCPCSSPRPTPTPWQKSHRAVEASCDGKQSCQRWALELQGEDICCRWPLLVIAGCRCS
jgi:hypothetical protein